MLTYLLGPFLAFLPRRWRNALPLGEGLDWRRATAMSGFGEAAVALAALMFWYSYYMNLLVNNGLDSALSGKMGPGVTDQAIGFTALVIWATHPLTLLFAYGGVEGAVRLMGAAFTETNLGTLPLFLADKIFLKLSGRSAPSVSKSSGYAESNLSSYARAIREKALLKKLPHVPDELVISKDGAEEMLEIRACRRKPDWDPPRTVRYQDSFYRLEAAAEGTPPRPFRYTLRKLSAGVMGRTVLVYAPQEAPVLAKK
ncbi:MAG TPA: hypothetical protein VJO16_19620 [Candidatus Acidoferrum sp.]|nr:hypothetical protein [Candidatus Acidoferrum sp.]